MKLYPLILCLALCGCSTFIPKRVELFQDKVQKFPEATTAQQETQRQAALSAKIYASQTVDAALSEGASTNVVTSAKATEVLTDAVSTSLGPPKTKSTLAADELADKLLTAVAKLDRKVDAFAKGNDENAGKKIEDTGLVKVPYLVWTGGAVVIFLGLIFVVKLVLTALSATNPGAAVGLGVVNVASTLAGKAFAQVVKGGEDFKTWVKQEISDPTLQQKILTVFQTVQMKAQDHDVQDIVKKLT